MKTKAEVLEFLKKNLKKGHIINLFYFTVSDWEKKPEFILKKILSLFSDQILAVRSSSINEDQAHQSKAGQFESLLNVKSSHLKESINSVISSFGNYRNSNDQILIQPMLQNVCISGVFFSSEPSSNSPYFVINYFEGEDTSAVTGGKKNNLKTIYISKFFNNDLNIHIEEKFLRLIEVYKEITVLLDIQNLDIEFAFDKNNNIYIFQARHLIIEDKKYNNIGLEKTLKQIQVKFSSLNKRHPYLFGDKTILANMPDWNPAEIIGIKPKKLAFSLYKELVTDNIWAYQRDNYGYKNLRSFPLMIDFGGIPFIDVRVSFNSFLPKNLPEELSEKIINYYVEKLTEKPELHDKIEFEIVYSCYTFDIHEKLEELLNYNFSIDEILLLKKSLKELTINIIDCNSGLWLQDLEKIDELKKRQEIIINNKDLIEVEKIFWLIEDCKRYGTLPFAGLARAGFIAMQLLNSLVSKKIISTEQKNFFMYDLNTVSSHIGKDFRALSKEDFLSKYGHLRPGTYDITLPKYDESPDAYFDWYNKDNIKIENKSTNESEFKLTLSQFTHIDLLLKENELNISVVELFEFLRLAIEGREYSKFIFSKSLSTVLSLIKETYLSETNNIKLEDLAHLDIKTLLSATSQSWDALEAIKTDIEKNKELYEITKKLILPPMIFSPEDIFYFKSLENKPNFITQKRIKAKVQKNLENKSLLKNNIVFIKSADPGYDWIFSHDIKGFITAYGGVNSHMAIRANELNLPAIIGAGEFLYNLWSNATQLIIDCENQKVEIIE